MSRILEYLLARQAEMTELLERLVMMESPSHEPAAVNELGAYLARCFETMDATAERLPQERSGDHWRVCWGRGGQQILLVGHLDTVWPLGETGRRPFRIVTQAASGTQRATGPGTFDMKGGLVTALYAVKVLRELGLEPAHRLTFLFNADEEVGSPTSRPVIEAEAKRSDAVLVLEPSRFDALVTWRKGVGRFELEIEGLASHSGAAHERGVSAVVELAHQILHLEAMTDYGRGTTVNVGTVQGGSKSNVRPAAAHASLDLRVATQAEGQRMVEAILGLQPVNPKTRLAVSGGMNRPPWSPSAQGDALFARARRVASTLGLEVWPSGAGGGSDGNFTAALGVPTLDGLGVVGEDAHALTEWVDLTSLPTRAAFLAELVLDLGR